MTATETTTAWRLKGKGYEFCNCAVGCSCNFSGFPTSPDGSCKAVMGSQVTEGNCGDVDLSGINILTILDWPGPIHEGNGRTVFVVPPAVTDEQLDCITKIYTGQLGGMPWAILGTTFEVAGVVRTEIEFDGEGVNSGFRAEGVGEGRGEALKNPVTGDENYVSIVPETGFIWKRGHCGQGSFRVEAEGISLDFTDSNWIHYELDWTNQD